MSKAEFAFGFADAIGLSTDNLVRISSSSVYALAAHRPTDMRMQCNKFEDYMKTKLPRLIDEIQVLAREYA